MEILTKSYDRSDTYSEIGSNEKREPVTSVKFNGKAASSSSATIATPEPEENETSVYVSKTKLQSTISFFCDIYLCTY